MNIPFTAQVILHRSDKHISEISRLFSEENLSKEYVVDIEFPGITVGRNSYVINDDGNLIISDNKWFRYYQLVPKPEIDDNNLEVENVLQIIAGQFLSKRFPPQFLDIIDITYDIRIL